MNTAFRAWRRRARGFSLVELLPAAALSALLAAALAAALAVGLRVLRETVGRGAARGEYAAGLARLERDLRNAQLFRPVPYVGRRDAVRLVVPAEDPGDKASAKGLDVVQYQYDAAARALTRKAWRFPAEEPPDYRSERIISSVDDFRLAYYDSAPDRQGPARWRDDWDGSTSLPEAVSARLALRGPAGVREVEWVTARPVR